MDGQVMDSAREADGRWAEARRRGEEWTFLANPRATTYTECDHYPTGVYDSEPCPYCPQSHQRAAAQRGWKGTA
jgi:hypothetical protein